MTWVLKIVNTFHILENFLCFDFSDCSNTQLLYHELSSKVMDIAFEKVAPIAKSLVEKCHSHQAWSNPYSSKYKDCTKGISATNGLIFVNLEKIENFVANNLDTKIPPNIKIVQMLEEFDEFDEHRRMNEAIRIIQNDSSSYENNLSCKLLLLKIIAI